MSEAPSPDGAHVARLWCENLCDVPGRLTLTISPATRVVERTPSPLSGFPPAGTMPDEDVVRRISLDTAKAGMGVAMEWEGAGALALVAPCVMDHGQVQGQIDVAVAVRSTEACPAS